MNKHPKKHESPPAERSSVWQRWTKNLKAWIWYHQEHPDWYDIDIQGAVHKHIIVPVRNLWKHLKELGRDRSEAKLPETESRIGQLFLFAW